MFQPVRVLAAICAAALAVGPVSVATASAEPIVAQAAPAASPNATTPVLTGSIIGVVTDVNGSPLSGATVSLTGPVSRSTTSNASGAYSFTNLPQGLYQITFSRAGYSGAQQTDYPVIPGGQAALNVQLAAATLSSLREIGRVSVNAGRARFNSTPASVQTISGQTFEDQGQPQVQRILDQIPGIVIDHPGTSADNASPGAITFPSIRGGLGFETASLIDGHPLAVGNFGDYVTTFLNGYTLGSVEVIKGPGAAAPEVNYAIGGTVNFRTKDPTPKPYGQITLGTDSYGGQFSNFLFSGTTRNGKLGWVLDYGINGTPGPLKDAPGYTTLSNGVLINGVAQSGFTTNPVSNSATNGIQNNPNYATTSLVACCIPVNTTYNNKTELVKLRYNLSSATTATVSYLGSQTWTDQNGNHVYQYNSLFTPNAAYTGIAGGPVAGQTVPTWQNVFFPANEWEVNNEPIYQAEVRSTFRGDSVVARFYAASINRLQYNGINDPNASYTQGLNIYGSFVNAAGTKPTVVYNGQYVPVTFTPSGGVCNNQAGAPQVYTACNPGQTPVAYTSPFYFRSAEEDKLHGVSFEYDHFLNTGRGDVISFAYDQTNSNTHAYDYTGSPTSQSVPAGSKQQFQTFLLRGIFNPTPRLNVTLSNYIDQYYQRYTTNGVVPLVGGSGNVFNNFLTFQDSRSSRYDGRLGLVYRASQSAAVRFSAGSAIAPPYPNLLNQSTTGPVLTQAKDSYTNTVNAGTLKPETSFGYDLGGDFRLSADGQTILTTDVYLTNLFNQFVRPTYFNGCINTTNTQNVGGAQPCPAGTLPLFSTSNANLGNARYSGIELQIRRDNPVGFGYTVSGELLRAYPYNINPCFYSTTITNGQLNCTVVNTNLGIVPNLNFQATSTSGSPGSYNSVSNTSIPYSKGYGEVRYRWANNALASFGMQYLGPNNSYNRPAFFIANANVRVPIIDRKTTFQVSADNLFATYSTPYIDPFGGTAIPLVNGKVGLTNGNAVGPRTFRFILQRNFDFIGGFK